MCSVVLKWQGTQQHGEAGVDDELAGATTPESVVGRPEEHVLGRLEVARNTATGRGSSA